MSENYSMIQNILNGDHDIKDHVKSIFDGEIYNESEIQTFIASMYDIMLETSNLRDFIFFDFLEKEKKFEFTANYLNISSFNDFNFDPKTRLVVSPKHDDLLEFIKRDFYCEGLTSLYDAMHVLYKLSHESFIAVWSLAITNGVFIEIIKKYKPEEAKPLRKKNRRK